MTRNRMNSLTRNTNNKLMSSTDKWNGWLTAKCKRNAKNMQTTTVPRLERAAESKFTTFVPNAPWLYFRGRNGDRGGDKTILGIFVRVDVSKPSGPRAHRKSILKVSKSVGPEGLKRQRCRKLYRRTCVAQRPLQDKTGHVSNVENVSVHSRRSFRIWNRLQDAQGLQRSLISNLKR